MNRTNPMSGLDDLRLWTSRFPARIETSSEHVLIQLRQAIRDGVLEQGLPLRQEELAKTFGVSRMPVREALRQLQIEGLVDFKPRYGFTVSRFGKAEIIEVSEIRWSLESLAIRLAIAGHDANSLATAESYLTILNSNGCLDEAVEAHKDFHLALYRPCGRPRLLTLIENHICMAERFLRIESSQFPLAAKEVKAEHIALFKAFTQRDVEKAVETLTQHVLINTRKVVAGLFDKGASTS
jgi:DNA-binding GntR family transcriptional regulator